MKALREEAMDWDTAEEYFARSAQFRGMVAQVEPGFTGREPLMRYPGDGNRQERRALKVRATRARAARKARHSG
jgi:hypothetical protein